VNTFVYCLVGSYFSQLAAIAVVIKLFSYLFANHLLFMLVFLLSYLPYDLRSLLIPAKWAFNSPTIFKLVFCPLCEAFQMKSIHAYGCAGGSSIALNNLHMANGT